MTKLSSRLLLLLTIMLSSCLRPNDNALSGGKKLAADEALKAIDEAYAQKDDALFAMRMENVNRAVSFANLAGDPSRKADVQISIDLDYCVTALNNYSYFREHLSDSPGLSEKEQEKGLEEMISKLRRDLGEVEP